jgi:pimeloyl-ACP methyl ester carboxylesterase
MIGRSLPEYVFIRTSIFGLRLVAPVSILYLVATLYEGRILLSQWLLGTAFAEATFFLFVYLPRKRFLQKPARHSPPALSREQRRDLFHKCLGHIDSSSGDDYPSGWFSAPNPKRENVIDWILWAIFSSKDYKEEWAEEIDEYLQELERVTRKKLEEGRNDQTKSMRLTFDPVAMLHRPLTWYAIVGIVDAFTFLSMRLCGFQYYATPTWFTVFPPRPLTVLSRPAANPNLPYWYRPHKSETKLPILFLHGIGIGLYPYIPFLKDLIKRDPDVGIIAIELLPICMRITNSLPCRDEMCDSITDILDSLNISRVVVASHSYGTVTTAHMFHSPELAPRIAATLLIDPIPFLLHLPNVAYNFVYRKPQTANEWQLWYMTSRDPDISHALARHFFWSENVLWKEELEGLKVGIVLSGSDQIVHSEEVRRYLTGEDDMKLRWENGDMEVLFFPGLDHATVFDTAERRGPLLDILHKFTQFEPIGAV